MHVFMRAATARLSEHGYQMPGLFVLLHPFNGTEYGQEYLNLQKHQLVLELSREGDWASCLEFKKTPDGMGTGRLFKKTRRNSLASYICVAWNLVNDTVGLAEVFLSC